MVKRPLSNNKNVLMDKTLKINYKEYFSDNEVLKNAKDCIIDKTVTGLGYTHWMLNTQRTATTSLWSSLS